MGHALKIAMQQKPDFSDLEAIAHKLHSKAEFDKVENLFSQLRKEILDQLSKFKKESKANKLKTKQEEAR